MHTRGTNPRLAHQGAGSQGNIFSFRSREKNALDIPSYRSGVITSLRFYFAKIGVNEFYKKGCQEKRFCLDRSQDLFLETQPTFHRLRCRGFAF